MEFVGGEGGKVVVGGGKVVVVRRQRGGGGKYTWHFSCTQCMRVYWGKGCAAQNLAHTRCMSLICVRAFSQ